MPKLSKAKISTVAKTAIKNAPNKDWHRSPYTLVGGLEEHPVEGYGLKFEKKIRGKATVAEYRWDEIPDNGNRFPFIGFLLAVMVVDGKTIYETRPLIRSLGEKDKLNAAHSLGSRFCPQCGSVDSVKQRAGRRGPEYVVIHYSCTGCSYTDTDVMD